MRLLGKGGMAAVFLGEREGGDFRQHVAMKLLRRGLYSEIEQRLFQRERQVLASLNHPNIARLIDGGVTDAGVPYLVMEYVDGVPITRYASAHALDARARLALFLTVCRAVEAAHRALIVHRDIKPSNILVADDGTVKLLDFGIAKLLEDDVEGADRRRVHARLRRAGADCRRRADHDRDRRLRARRAAARAPARRATSGTATRRPSALVANGDARRDAYAAAQRRRCAAISTTSC